MDLIKDAIWGVAESLNGPYEFLYWYLSWCYIVFVRTIYSQCEKDLLAEKIKKIQVSIAVQKNQVCLSSRKIWKKRYIAGVYMSLFGRLLYNWERRNKLTASSCVSGHQEVQLPTTVVATVISDFKKRHSIALRYFVIFLKMLRLR